jgi:thiol-disulfide isomerase/thioredoxin
MEWLNSAPLTVRGLRGKVVVIRFWTNTCPYCEATAPALRQLDREFRERGAVVIGMYHPKPPGAERPVAEVERMARKWGWEFPVGLDMGWKSLEAFWLGSGSRSATSATFIVDRRGVIRFVHPGPEFHPGGPAEHRQCRADYADVRQAIAALVGE